VNIAADNHAFGGTRISVKTSAMTKKQDTSSLTEIFESLTHFFHIL